MFSIELFGSDKVDDLKLGSINFFSTDLREHGVALAKYTRLLRLLGTLNIYGLMRLILDRPRLYPIQLYNEFDVLPVGRRHTNIYIIFFKYTPIVQCTYL